MKSLWQPYFRFWVAHPDETVFYHRFRDSAAFPKYDKCRVHSHAGHSLYTVFRLFTILIFPPMEKYSTKKHQAFTQKGNTYVAQGAPDMPITITLAKQGDDIVSADITMDAHAAEQLGLIGAQVQGVPGILLFTGECPSI